MLFRSVVADRTLVMKAEDAVQILGSGTPGLFGVAGRASEATVVVGKKIAQDRQNDQPSAIIFEFAKTTASGGPTIAQNDKGVVFSTQAGSIPIKVQFDLSKMTDKQGADY